MAGNAEGEALREFLDQQVTYYRTRARRIRDQVRVGARLHRPGLSHLTRM